MKSIALVAAALALCVAACSRQPSTTPQSRESAAAPFKPIATVKQVMQGITIPASNMIFAVAAGAPADEAAWQAVEAGALAVGESGNLLLIEPRAKDTGEWRQYALALVAAGQHAAAAAHAKDVDATSAAGDELYEVCEHCHAKYFPNR